MTQFVCLQEKHVSVNKVAVNPFLAMAEPSGSSAGGKSEILDLFANDTAAPAPAKSPNASDDLFSLGNGGVDSSAGSSNPFADILAGLGSAVPAAAATGPSPTPAGFNAFGGSNAAASGFATSDNFAAAFGSSSNSNVGNVPFFSFCLILYHPLSQLVVLCCFTLSVWLGPVVGNFPKPGPTCRLSLP